MAVRVRFPLRVLKKFAFRGELFLVIGNSLALGMAQIVLGALKTLRVRFNKLRIKN